jgi:hypothetical protein
MAGHGEKKERLTEQAVAALLTQPTIVAAAAAVGIDEATLRGWLKDAAFVAAYRAARRQVVEQALGVLQGRASDATATLARNLTCGKAGDEIRAAVALLDFAVRGVELADLAEEVAALRAEVEALKHGGGVDAANGAAAAEPGGPVAAGDVPGPGPAAGGPGAAAG